MSRDLNPRKPSPVISKSSTSSASTSLATQSKYKELSDAPPSTTSLSTPATPAAAPAKNTSSSSSSSSPILAATAAPETAASSGNEPHAKHGAHGKAAHKTSPTPPRINFQSNLIQQIQNSVHSGTPSSTSRSSTAEEWNQAAGRGNNRKTRQASHAPNHTDSDRHHAGQHVPHHAKARPFHAKDSREDGKHPPASFRSSHSHNNNSGGGGSGNGNGSGAASSHSERLGPRSHHGPSESRKAEDSTKATDAGPIVKGHPSHTAQKAAAQENSKLKESKEPILPPLAQTKDTPPLTETHAKAHSSSQPKSDATAKQVESQTAPLLPSSDGGGGGDRPSDLVPVTPSHPSTTTATSEPTTTLAFDIETPNGTLIRVPFSVTDDPAAVALRFCTDHSMLDLLDSLIYHFKDSIRIHAAFQQP